MGDRVELLSADDVSEIPVGSRGVVEEIEVTELLGTWVGIKWEDGEFCNVFPDSGAVLGRVE